MSKKLIALTCISLSIISHTASGQLQEQIQPVHLQQVLDAVIAVKPVQKIIAGYLDVELRPTLNLPKYEKITAFAYSNSGKFLALATEFEKHDLHVSRSYNITLQIWDTEHWKCVARLERVFFDAQKIIALRFLPNDNEIVARTYHTYNNKNISEIYSVCPLKFSRESNITEDVVETAEKFALMNYYCQIVLNHYWNTSRRGLSVNSRDGRYYAQASAQENTRLSHPNTNGFHPLVIELFDRHSNRSLPQFTQDFPADRELKITDLLITPDNRYLAISFYDTNFPSGKYPYFGPSYRDGSHVMLFLIPEMKCIFNKYFNNHRIIHIKFFPQIGALGAKTADNQLSLIWKDNYTKTLPSETVLNAMQETTDLAVNPNNKQFVTARNNSLFFTDLNTNTQAGKLPALQSRSEVITQLPAYTDTCVIL